MRKSRKACYLGPLPLGSGAALELRPLLSVLARIASQIGLCLAVYVADPVLAWI